MYPMPHCETVAETELNPVVSDCEAPCSSCSTLSLSRTEDRVKRGEDISMWSQHKQASKTEKAPKTYILAFSDLQYPNASV